MSCMWRTLREYHVREIVRKCRGAVDGTVDRAATSVQGSQNAEEVSARVVGVYLRVMEIASGSPLLMNSRRDTATESDEKHDIRRNGTDGKGGPEVHLDASPNSIICGASRGLSPAPGKREWRVIVTCHGSSEAYKLAATAWDWTVPYPPESEKATRGTECSAHGHPCG